MIPLLTISNFTTRERAALFVAPDPRSTNHNITPRGKINRQNDSRHPTPSASAIPAAKAFLRWAAQSDKRRKDRLAAKSPKPPTWPRNSGWIASVALAMAGLEPPASLARA
jgi:hypothetical protein